MPASQRAEHVRRHRLHAHTHPVHPVLDEGAQQLDGHIVGIALDRHLGAVDLRDRVDDGTQLVRRHHRRCATAHEHRRGDGHPSATARPMSTCSASRYAVVR
ncbi:MAG: hypothetical protein R2697_13945 [Ilumatobacteraceae bacterium]